MESREIKELLEERIAYHKRRQEVYMGRMKEYNDAGLHGAADDMWHGAIEHQSVAYELALIVKRIEGAVA